MYPYIHILGRDIGTYGLCLILGFALVFVCALLRGKPKGLILEDLMIVGAFVLGFALLGGGLLYLLVSYSLSEILEFIRNGEYSFLSGGIVFYGGLFGGIAGAMLGIQVAGCKLGVIIRSVVPFIPLGHAIGRIGCLMAGCCYGFTYNGLFALYYPHSVAGLSPEQGYFPVQVLEALVNVGICWLLVRYEKRAKRNINVLLSYLLMYAVSRFFLEMLRGDAVRGGWSGLSTSQIISIVLVGICTSSLLYIRKSDNR